MGLPMWIAAGAICREPSRTAVRLGAKTDRYCIAANEDHVSPSRTGGKWVLPGDGLSVEVLNAQVAATQRVTCI